MTQHVTWRDADGNPLPWGSVDIDCRQCDLTLTVPITHIDSTGTVHVDHDYLAAHHATHPR